MGPISLSKDQYTEEYFEKLPTDWFDSAGLKMLPSALEQVKDSCEKKLM